MFKKLLRNPFILFLPFLGYYTYLIVHNKWPSLYGDEVRYVDFAKHLLHGFYSPPAPHINLWNGPGFPLLLAPFVALHTPELYITLMNGLYFYLAIVLLHKSISKLANFKTATVLCLLLAIYPNALAILPILYTEAFTGLLISTFIYSVTLYYVKRNSWYSISAGLLLGAIMLTKIIFGYVIVICLGICLIGMLVRKNKTRYLQSAKILAIAFAVAIPWLAYTYHLTGKVFYWGNSGGMSLYWMSTPYEHEYGDWKDPNMLNKQYPFLFKSPQTTAILKNNHAKEIAFILKHNDIEQDALFKQIAIENIKKNPAKFISNYGNNFSRMLFNFPYSYAYQDSGIVRNIIIGSSVLWMTVFGLVLTLFNWRRIAFPVKLVLLITVVYLGLSGALSAYPRQLDVMMPALFFWIGFLVSKMQNMSLKFAEEKSLDSVDFTELEEIGWLRRNRQLLKL